MGSIGQSIFEDGRDMERSHGEEVLVGTLKGLGIPIQTAIEKVKEGYALSDEQAKDVVNKYWN